MYKIVMIFPRDVGLSEDPCQHSGAIILLLPRR
jgi:hypothetical protein